MLGPSLFVKSLPPPLCVSLLWALFDTTKTETVSVTPLVGCFKKISARLGLRAHAGL
jgi:hypothetical protein